MNTPVNFETAKLLEKIGFNEPTEANWWILAEDYFENYKNNQPADESKMFFTKNADELGIATCIDEDTEHIVYHVLGSPTIAEVVMWLYEKHGIFVTVTIPYSEFGKFSAEIWGKESDNIKILLVDGMSVFNTINQAYEEGIEYILNKLI